MITSYHKSQTLLSGKIQGYHHDRLAIIYIRQSTLQQVERHSESTKLQYALVEKAYNLGWAKDKVIVIDDDLGRSGTNAEGRPGFQRLVAEVGLDRVGMILGIEMSRLARSCRDWYQLLEVCALFRTLIGDADGIYDPTSYNDRLLLGLKGTMSEAELHVIKQRMIEGKKAKARRGELGMQLPRGYIKRPSGEIAKDPDEQVQSTIQLIFELFEQFSTVNAVLKYLVTNKIKLPDNVVLAIIPVYNIGGCLNRSADYRVDQNGPEEFGFRGNSQNLDLNRDFIKCDSKEARSFTEIFHLTDPDVFLDNHVGQ